ncbi:DNA-binding transcriptional repressor MarR [Nonomuraea coxensis DSM 45129]|uniref:DNA-binding transcriptional repressor MarR n=1 Tax=Nonomuraea coxensis DSM 45129 TaxID=1122611 RepID=A0ABX8U614_9ACTN|nr:MarR family transcriptional regulator [Nonomuraea coxensis]QYC42549.1 DNA-binding transcriptional repressor MarR [Nonomuraea coxensis DSM 45129]
MSGQDAPDDRAAAAFRVWAAMRALVLEEEDRRKEVADALGMSFSRAKALRRLLPGPLTMRELTALLGTDKPYTTLVVDDLEGRGYVRRTVHPDDRRRRIVTLTEAGRAAAEQGDRILGRPPRALAALGPDDLAALDRVMAAIRSPGAAQDVTSLPEKRAQATEPNSAM